MTPDPPATRRTILGLAAGTIAASGAAYTNTRGDPAPIVDVHATGRRDHGAALEAIQRYAEAERIALGLPGMTIALAGADGFSATLSVGYADIDNATPVRPDQLFQIGSISKSLTALCLHHLSSLGKVDLNAPISRYLDGAPLPAEMISCAQLMNHAGGLPHDSWVFPDSPNHRMWSGFAPGTRYSYSNIGYQLLGLVIDTITGIPHPLAIEQLVLRPLGMATARAHIVCADRALYATGYSPARDDRPGMSRDRLVPAQFWEVDSASGCVAASARDMIAYLRFVITLGRGYGAPLISDESAKNLIATAIDNEDFGPSSRYASGFATVSVDGAPCLHHTGGMKAFSSSYHVDPLAGIGCFASVNARLMSYRPTTVTRFAIELLRGTAADRSRPTAPDPLHFRRVERPSDWVGQYYAPDGRGFSIVEHGPELILRSDRAIGRIETASKQQLVTDHPTFTGKPIERLVGRADELWWGDIPFGRPHPTAPNVVPPNLAGLTGDYVGTAGNHMTVTARRNRLYAQDLGEIVRRPDGFWSPLDDRGGVTRLWFDRQINGQCIVMNFCGMPMARLR